VKKKSLIVSLMMATLLLAVASATAQEAHPAEGQEGGALMWVFITSAFGMALVSSCAAIAMSVSVKSFCEGVARNPSAANQLQFGLILTLVLIETLALYVLAVIFLKVGM